MQKTTLEPSLLARVTQAARYVMQGVAPDSWFGPMQPLQPMAPPDVIGRRFDYPTGYNLISTPRSYEGVTFEELRVLADNCDILRSVIETRKDQMEALEWKVRVRVGTHGEITSPTDEQKQRIEQVTAFLHCPDKEHGFDQWLRQILEDMFVIDGVALYKRRNRGGGLYALEILDGATIKILMDDHGRLPQAPDPAYQQVLKGVPASDYTRDELWYVKHNPRSHKVYGYSHVEQVMVTVNILIRRSMYQLEYYREGSQPDAFVGLPKEWNQDQIIAFQKHFDAMLAGNMAMRRRLRFMPGDFKYQETKAPPLKDVYDEFLARIICYVFSISPEPFVGQMNRATAETAQGRAIDEGLAPLMRFVRGLMNRIIAVDFASPDLEFFWNDTHEQDPAQAAEIDVAYVQAGIKTADEVRSTLGLPELGGSIKKNFSKFAPQEQNKFDFLELLNQKDTLFIGEGNLSFALSLVTIKQIIPYNIVVTTFEDKTELTSVAEDNAVKLQSLGITVLNGVDATNLSVTFGTKCFDNIIFQFPNTGSREVINGHNPNFILIRDFLLSASLQLVSGGRVIISVVDSPYYQGAFQFDKAANIAGFLPPEVYPFDPSVFIGYGHTMTHQDESALERCDQFCTLVFKKPH